MGNVAIKGKVIKVMSGTDVVINKGAEDGVRAENRFLVYRLGEEMFDPDTNESLGTLELVCGEGKPEHIQERFTTLRSCRTQQLGRRTIIKSPAFFMAPEREEIYEPQTDILPFEDVDVGCLVKQVR